MPALELALVLLVYCQPPIVFGLLAVVGWRQLHASSGMGRLRGPRMRTRSVVFFECAAYSRQHVTTSYDINSIVTCVAFIIYDVDLLFFFPEAIHADMWAPVEAIMVTALVTLFGYGLWYDARRMGFR